MMSDKGVRRKRECRIVVLRGVYFALCSMIRWDVRPLVEGLVIVEDLETYIYYL